MDKLYKTFQIVTQKVPSTAGQGTPLLQKTWAAFFLLFLNCFLLPTSLFSQQKEFQFRLYAFEDGLTHRNVFKIQQDTTGFIWIATISGLNKYDGHEFTHFTTHSKTHPIPHDYVNDMVIDANNQIWLACGNGLALLDAADNSLKQILPDESSATVGQDRKLHNLFMNEEGILWTSAYLENSGETWFQGVDGNILKDALKARGNYAQRPIAEMGGRIYFNEFENELKASYFEGFHKNSKKATENYIFKTPVNEPSFSRIIQLQTTGDTLWALLDNGQVYFLKKGSPEFEKHPITETIFNTGKSTSFLVEENGNIWVGGRSTLWHYDADSKKVINFNEQLREIFHHTATLRQIFKDQTGVLWIATDFGALTLAQSDKLFTNYLNEGNEYCNDGFCSTRGMTEDAEGNIYISYYNSIHVLDPKTNYLRPLFNRNKNFAFPYGMLYHDNYIWLGNGQRINLITKQVDTLIYSKKGGEGVTMLDKDGQIWFGCARKMCFFNTENPQRGKQQLTPYSDPNGLVDTLNFKNISYLLQGKSGNFIWVGTKENGVYKLNKEKGGVAHYSTHPTSQPRLSHERVIAMSEDEKENLWIATAKGLNKLHIPTEKLKVYTTENGLPNDFINGILLEGDSAVWVSTDNGLSRLDIEKESFTNFFEKDGLSKNEFNRISFYKSRNGRMYFGGLNGINAFFPGPHFAKKNKNRPEGRLFFTSFSKYDDTLDSLLIQQNNLNKTDTFHLSHSDKFFTFALAEPNCFSSSAISAGKMLSSNSSDFCFSNSSSPVLALTNSSSSFSCFLSL